MKHPRHPRGNRIAARKLTATARIMHINAEKLAMRAWRSRRMPVPHDGLDRAQHDSRMATDAYQSGDYAEAVVLAKRSLAITRKVVATRKGL